MASRFRRSRFQTGAGTRRALLPVLLASSAQPNWPYLIQNERESRVHVLQATCPCQDVLQGNKSAWDAKESRLWCSGMTQDGAD